MRPDVHFIDTTMLVGAGDRKDQFHLDGKSLFEALPHRRFGMALVSDFVLSEVATILGRRRGPKEAAAFVQAVLASPNVRSVFVDADTSTLPWGSS